MHAFADDGTASRQASRFRNIGIVSFNDLVRQLGDPPPHFFIRGTNNQNPQRLPLAQLRDLTPLDELLRRRTTCRNYDLLPRGTCRSTPSAT